METRAKFLHHKTIIFKAVLVRLFPSLFKAYENYVVPADEDASIVGYKLVAVVFGGIVENQVHVVVAFHQNTPILRVVFQAYLNIAIDVFEEKGQRFLACFQDANYLSP